MNLILRRWLNNCKRRIQRRLDKADLRGCSRPMLTASMFLVFLSALAGAFLFAINGEMDA